MIKVIPHVRYPWKIEQSYSKLLVKQQRAYRKYFMQQYRFAKEYSKRAMREIEKMGD